MKIAFYNPAHITYGSGPEIWLSRLMPDLQKAGHDITLITTSFLLYNARQEINQKLIGSGIDIIKLDSFPLPLSRSPIPYSLQPLANKTFDLLYYSNGFALQDFVAWLIARKTNARLIAAIHAPTNSYWLHVLYQQYFAKLVIRNAAQVQTSNSDDFVYYHAINPRTIKLMPYILDKNILSAIPAARWHDKTLRIMFVNRLDEQKNIPLLLKVIKQLRPFSGFHFYIAGTGAYQTEVTAAARQFSNLTYLSYIPNEELINHFRNKHVFINISAMEAFSLILLEAAGAGLLNIVTKTKGLASDQPELVYHSLPCNVSVKAVTDVLLSLREVYENNRRSLIARADQILSDARKIQASNKQMCISSFSR